MMDSSITTNVTARASIEARAGHLFREQRLAICRRTDRLFALLMLAQWVAAVATAMWLTPHTWIGATRYLHPHVWAAVLLGGLITLPPVLLSLYHSGTTLTRHVVGVCQMLMGALLIHLTGGRIETHFHVFGSLAFLAPGEGSTFSFDARFSRADNEAACLERILPINLEGVKVLIVDDNEINRRLLHDFSSAWHMAPTSVPDAVQAVAVIREHAGRGDPFRLILLDAMMPDMDGFQLAECLRQEPNFTSATILMLSSAGNAEDARRCRELGMSGYLSKPIVQAELREAIAIALGASVKIPVRGGAAASSSSASGPRRILLAEDNPVNQRVAVRLLQKRGYTVSVADNGKLAVDLFRSDSPDMILMDVQMPELDGFEATAAIRALERAAGCHVPIVAMTAHAMKGDRERCLAAGMDDYISKPVKPEELWSVIDKLLPAGAQPEVMAGTH